MMFMAPTLFTLTYLNSVGRLTGDLKHKGVKYIKEGYKREMSFRKDDGSFSAFQTQKIIITGYFGEILIKLRQLLMLYLPYLTEVIETQLMRRQLQIG